MINNFEEFDEYITDDMVERYLDMRFKRLCIQAWDEYQMDKAREFLREVQDGECESPEDS